MDFQSMPVRPMAEVLKSNGIANGYRVTKLFVI